jgi:putative membrane protein
MTSSHPMTTSKPVILEQATFNPDVRKYWLLGGTFTLLVTLVGIPLLPIWWLLGMWITGRYLERLECTLTKRTLIVKRGFFIRVEKTIPLDKITDLGMVEGPLMRVFDIQALSIETAGSTSQGALVKLYGIENVEAFRDAVLAQRDRMLEKEPNDVLVDAPEPVDGGFNAEAVALLRDIRDELKNRPL